MRLISFLTTLVPLLSVNSIVHIHQILDVALMNLHNADRVVRFGASQEIDTVTIYYLLGLISASLTWLGT